MKFDDKRNKEKIAERISELREKKKKWTVQNASGTQAMMLQKKKKKKRIAR